MKATPCMDPIWFSHWRFISPLETFAGSQKYVTVPIIPIRNESVRSFYTTVSKLNLYIAKPWKQAFVGLCEFFDTSKPVMLVILGYVTHLDNRMTLKKRKYHFRILLFATVTPYWPISSHRKALARPCLFATATIWFIFAWSGHFYLLLVPFLFGFYVSVFCTTMVPAFLVLTIGTPLSPIWVPPISWPYMDQR